MSSIFALVRALFLAPMFALAAVLTVPTIGQSTPTNSTPPVLAPSVDAGWPRDFVLDSNKVRVFQPQVTSWPNLDRINFLAAVSIAPVSAPSDWIYGTIEVDAATEVSYGNRLVVLTDRKIRAVQFSDQPADVAARLEKTIRASFSGTKPLSVSLDRLIAGMDLSKLNVPRVDVSLAPPPIYTSTTPAVLMVLIGKPRFQAAPGSNGVLLYALNTNWDLFLEPASKRYFLRNDSSWLTTNDLEKGTWTAASSLPAAFSTLPSDANWQDVLAAMPPKAGAVVPKVFVAHEPSELIVLDGEAQLEPIDGTSLMLVVNADNDLVYDSVSHAYYLLAAGRWFRAATLNGPWESASSSLPADFARIGADSSAGHLLASIPGTPAATHAAILASIPQKATVTRSAMSLTVAYNGEPMFVPIDGTTVSYARNTPSAVLLVGGRYYCCSNAVWFTALTPKGAWVVADVIPAAIYTIPPTSSMYSVTTVRVYDSTPDVVVYGYTSGYSGATVAATGVVMFGLGLAVGAVIADDDCCWNYAYPSCYYSYGCGAYWYGGCGGYVCGGAHYGPYGGCGSWAAYNPSTGFYSRGGYAYGPGGATAYRAAYNPSTGVGGARTAGVTPYGSWTHGVATNGDRWVEGGTVDTRRGDAAAVHGSEGAGAAHVDTRSGNSTTVARTGTGEVYAGHNGEVYQRSDDGWQQVGGNRSTSTTRNDAAAQRDANLNSEEGARARGNAEANESQRFRDSGGYNQTNQSSGSSGSRSGSSGGSRGGGGGRGGRR